MLARLLTTFVLLVWTISCSNRYPGEGKVDLAILLKLTNASATSGAGTSTGTTATDTKKYIFVTNTLVNGNLGGISGADSKCSSDKTANYSNLPGVGADYKALIADSSGTRSGCSVANCTSGPPTGWILAANTSYYRSDGTLVMTTNTNAVFVFGTLSAPISSNSTYNWWTGLNTDWTGNSSANCSNWSDGTTGSVGTAGIGNSTSNTVLDNTAGFGNLCNSSNYLLCVRQ